MADGRFLRFARRCAFCSECYDMFAMPFHLIFSGIVRYKLAVYSGVFGAARMMTGGQFGHNGLADGQEYVADGQMMWPTVTHLEMRLQRIGDILRVI